MAVSCLLPFSQLLLISYFRSMLSEKGHNLVTENIWPYDVGLHKSRSGFSQSLNLIKEG